MIGGKDLMEVIMLSSEKTVERLVQNIQLFVEKRHYSIGEVYEDPFSSEENDGTFVRAFHIEGHNMFNHRQLAQIEIFLYDLGDLRHIKLVPYGEPAALAMVKERNKIACYWYSLSKSECKQIKKIIENPDAEEKYEKMKGCYVATCVYGSYDCPEVWTLRRYRDYSLSKTWHGRTFIKTYYAISPKLVKCFGDTNWFKAMWRGKLDRMVSKLNVQGYEDTPYDDSLN